ncbi:MAG: leucine-rich repeat protein [Polaribacter sp.]
MKKQILFIIALLISVTIYSQTFVDNNITYNITSTTTVEITSYNTAGGTDVVIPASVTNASTTYTVTSIGNLAFFNKGLTSVEMPNTITNIGNVAFRVNLLTNITIPNSVITIGSGAFVSNSQLNSVVLGSGLTTIGSSAFGGCALTHLVFPNSVTTIASGAFGNNQLVSITLGTSVTNIGSTAFSGNTATLNTVISKATTPPVITTDPPGGTADTFNFGGDRSGINLTVPAGTSTAYTSGLWTDFASVTETSSNVITFDTQGHTSGQILSNPYTITDGSETFSFTISGGSATNHIYRTSEPSCGASGMSHIYSGNTSQTTWTIETTSGNEIDLGNIRFDNVFACFSFTYNLTIEGFKNNVSTGSQSHSVSNVNSIFTSNANFNNVDKIVITASDLGNLGIDDINWESVASKPTLTTTAPSSVVNSSATLAGNITNNGGEAVIERGVVYSKTAENSDPIIGGIGVIKNTNGAGNGVFTESITGLAAGTQYSYKAYATNTVGISYGAIETFTTTGIGWLGVNSNWANTANWTSNTIPVFTDDIVISNTTIQPLINSSTNAVVNHITIDTSSSLTINAGGSLTIEGNLSQNGTFTINSDATSNGSLILKGIQSGSGTVGYHRFLSTSATSTQGWHLVASPVNGKNIDDFFGDVVSNGTKRGIAPYVNTNSSTLKWGYFENTDTPGFFTLGKGYTIKKTTAGTLNFSGSIDTNNAGVSIQVDATGDQFNVIGNPYTSYINSETFLDNVPLNRLTEKTIWLWDSEANSGVGEYITKNSATAYKVAPGQGFFVKALNTGDVNFSESIQTHLGGNTFLKQEPRPEIKLSITDGLNIKNTEIFYIKNKTTGFDDGYDSSMFNGFTNPFAVYSQLVTNSNGENLAIQTLPNSNYATMIIPIGVNATSGKEISFSLKADNFPSDIKVILEDKENNTFTRLDESNSDYTISLKENLNGIGRFYLHTTSAVLNVDDTISLQNISMYPIDNNVLRIAGLSKEKTQISIYTILGKEVVNTSFESNGVKDLELSNVSKGIYIVKLQTNRIQFTKKIILE